MTDTSGTPAGWYHASGDPDGTERYWDGAQWVGEPRVSSRIPAAPGAQLGDPVPSSVPPAYGAPWANVSAVPAGYQPYQAASARGTATPAGFGQRVVAFLIDFGLYVVGIFAVVVAAVIGGTIAEPLGVIAFIGGFIAVFAFMIWNLFVRQGRTGQTIGKKQQGIKLIKDDTGAPVGGGMAFVRYFLANLFSNFTCGIYGLLDVLWPLWDQDKKRLTDKMLNMSVVVA